MTLDERLIILGISHLDGATGFPRLGLLGLKNTILTLINYVFLDIVCFVWGCCIDGILFRGDSHSRSGCI